MQSISPPKDSKGSQDHLGMKKHSVQGQRNNNLLGNMHKTNASFNTI
jgi:hypothetical protein